MSRWNGGYQVAHLGHIQDGGDQLTHLGHIQDGGDHVGLEMVQVGEKVGAPGVLPYPVHRGSHQLNPKQTTD